MEKISARNVGAFGPKSPRICAAAFSMNMLSIGSHSKGGRGQMLFADAAFGLEEGGNAAPAGRNGSG